MKIAILGCGPAGMLAAHAVAESGNEPVILSRDKKASEIFGAQYLHRAIPSITKPEPDFTIDVIKVGTAEGYAQNVYGSKSILVSFDRFEAGDEIPGWDLRTAYSNLLIRYADYIFAVGEIDRAELHHLINNYPILYSTLPLQPFCRDHLRHRFGRKLIWVQHGDGTPNLIPGVNDGNMLYYNGLPPDGSVEDTIGPDWYRFSQLNRYQAWEFSKEPDREWPSEHTISRGFKVMGTDCDCWPEVRRIGRFGTWERGVLTHHAYEATARDMAEL